MRPSRMVARLTQVVVIVAEAALGARFFFRLFNGDSSRLFISWLYENTAALVDPFANWFPITRGGGFTVEFTTLAAMVGYGALGFVVLAVVGKYATSADRVVPKARFALSLDRRQ